MEKMFFTSEALTVIDDFHFEDTLRDPVLVRVLGAAGGDEDTLTVEDQ